MIFLTVTEPDHFEWKCKSIIVLWYVVFDVRSFLVNSWPSIRSTFLWFTWVAKWHTGHRPFVIIIIIVITIYYWISWEIRVPKNVRFLSCGMPGARSIDCGHSWNFFNGPFHAKIYNNNNNQFYQWFYIHFGRFFGGPDQWVPWLNAIQSIRKLRSTKNSLFKLSLSLTIVHLFNVLRSTIEIIRVFLWLRSLCVRPIWLIRRRTEMRRVKPGADQPGQWRQKVLLW